MTKQKTVYYTATSLDGFIADEKNSLDWLMQFGDGPPPDRYNAFISQIGALAMGSVTYEWIVHHIIRKDPPGEWPYSQPCWVFSTRNLPSVKGADVRFVRGDIPPVHDEMLKAADGKNIWIVGGGELVGRFHDHGLLDEIVATVVPVTLGAGAPLLPRRIARPPMKLVSTEVIGGTMVEIVLQVVR
jgi:dihydrofolate reductase